MQVTYSIYQINYERDTLRSKFVGSSSSFSCVTPDKKVQLALYDKVYEATDTVECLGGRTQEVILETLFRRFNVSRPFDFHGHSLSVSDIVVLSGGVNGTYYCDIFGWTEVEFF